MAKSPNPKPPKKRVNSIAKGKMGERQAVNFLKAKGFTDAYRTQQFNGNPRFGNTPSPSGGLSDISCPKTLPYVHIEVKYGYQLKDLAPNGHIIKEACKQAERDAPPNKAWVVLWKAKNFNHWALTCPMVIGVDNPPIITVREEFIAEMLNVLNFEVCVRESKITIQVASTNGIETEQECTNES